MDNAIQLIVKVQQFEDKRIEAKASWNIKELKGKLSEIYPTSTEEQKLIYSGKLLNDTVVLKDVLREYEGQEAHTVHLVFTPRSGRSQSKFESSQSARQSPPVASSTNQSTTHSPDMSASELRQRHASAASTATTNPSQEQQPQQPNIPTNYANAFYGSAGATPGDANSQMLAHQYAMQTWMQQAYTQYMNQYMTLLSSPEAFYQMNQQQQTQQSPNFAFLPPQMPFVPPSAAASDAAAPQSPNNEAAAAPAQAQAQPAAEAPQRRFPNIIQDEQENRDWLDILYSCSRLMILLCLVYFYSSPIRCLVVILIGISIYLYHIYKQNQNRLNNNNNARAVNLNVNRPPVVPAVQAENAEDEENAAEQPQAENGNENEPTAPEEPQVPLLTIVRTFVLSFFSSIIPEAPAL